MKTDAERREAARTKYYKQHAACPACKSVRVEKTLVGGISFNPDVYGDSNKAQCVLCDWRGKVADLVPGENEMVSAVVKLMMILTDEERMEVMRNFCSRCGCIQSKVLSPCQCRSDE